MIRLSSKEKGFSLIELMIVVAIMAILAAIAIPSFMRFSMKAKTSEATTNLAAIRTAEESYRSENDTYMACAATPLAWAGGAGAATPDAWLGGGLQNFADMGFAPDGPVRYQYTVASSALGAAVITSTFEATAEGDLDEDGGAVGNANNAVFTIDTEVATYPKAIKTGGDF